MRNLFVPVLLLAAFTSSGASAATVSGQVRDSVTQQPIAGAEVSIYYPGVLSFPTQIAATTTGTDGRYSAQFEYAGSVAGIARAAGYAARTHNGVACDSGTACISDSSYFPVGGGSATADFALGRAARISGLVHDGANGQPVGPAILHLRGNGSTAPAHTITVHTGSDGRFSADGLHPGGYTLSIFNASAGSEAGLPLVYLNSYWPQLHCDNVQIRCDSVVPGQIGAIAGQTVDIDVALRRGSYLRTRVVSNGDGLATEHYANVRSAAQPAVPGISGYTNEEGDYALAGPLLPGSVHVVLEPSYPAAYPVMLYPDRVCAGDGCDFGGAAVFGVPATDGIYTLDDVHVLPSRSVRGRVTSAIDGQPIAGLRVDAGSLREPQGYSWGFQPTASALTNANGEYALEGFAGTEVMVRTRQNGLGWLDQAWQNEDCDAPNLFCQRYTQHLPIGFSQQAHPTGIDFVLGRGASLRGRVIEETTLRPLAGYAVAVVPLAALRIGKPVLTDADGNFRIDGLTASAYYLFASTEPVYAYTAGVMYPGGPCSIAVTNNGLTDCFPTTQSPLELTAGGVIDALTLVMPRPDAIFGDRFEF